MCSNHSGFLLCFPVLSLSPEKLKSHPSSPIICKNKMARYPLAASFLALLNRNQVCNAHDDHDENTDAWSYLPVTLPTPLSDMSVVHINTNSTNSPRVVLTGGCDNPLGNEERFEEFFECPSLTNKVRTHHTTMQKGTSMSDGCTLCWGIS